jgi:hypothetical protein
MTLILPPPGPSSSMPSVCCEGAPSGWRECFGGDGGTVTTPALPGQHLRSSSDAPSFQVSISTVLSTCTHMMSCARWGSTSFGTLSMQRRAALGFTARGCGAVQAAARSRPGPRQARARRAGTWVALVGFAFFRLSPASGLTKRQYPTHRAIARHLWLWQSRTRSRRYRPWTCKTCGCCKSAVIRWVGELVQLQGRQYAHRRHITGGPTLTICLCHLAGGTH